MPKPKYAKPQLRSIINLTCPRCGETPLRKPGSWFEFREGCPQCNYRYEREEGYFWGSAWIVSYGFVGLVAILLAAYLLMEHPDLDALVVSAIVATVAAFLALAIHPFARATWMVFDQAIHPLSEKDRLNTPSP